VCLLQSAPDRCARLVLLFAERTISLLRSLKSKTPTPSTIWPSKFVFRFLAFERLWHLRLSFRLWCLAVNGRHNDTDDASTPNRVRPSPCAGVAPPGFGTPEPKCRRCSGTTTFVLM
jgi:hypothetical protein